MEESLSGLEVRIGQLRDVLMQVNHVDTEGLRDSLLVVTDILGDLRMAMQKFEWEVEAHDRDIHRLECGE